MAVPNRWRILPFLAAFVVVAYAYVWTVVSNRVDWHFGAPQRDYYSLLVHGFLDGKLSLKADVPAELLHSADPYDPEVRPSEIALHDASYFRGRYYIYYGVVPAVLVLLPFRLIAGFDLPLPIAVLALLLAQYAVALVILAGLRRRFFSGVHGMAVFLLCLGAGFASCAPILLRRSSMYELPIASGAFFITAAIGSLYAAWQHERRRTAWLAAASAAFGLAIGSRPIYLPAAAIIFAYPMALGRGADSRTRFKLWLSAILPAAIIGSGLALYNYLRFGNPAEFGLRYILSGVYEAKIQHFHVRYLLANAKAYFFSVTEWGRYFPFIHEVPLTGPRPEQYFFTDHPFGLVLYVPLLWLSALAFALGGTERTRSDATGLKGFVLVVAWIGFATAIFLLFFYAAAARYLGDFAPTLAVLGAIGGLTIFQWASDRRSGVRRILVPGLVSLASVVSTLTVFLFSVQMYGQVRAADPVAYARLERIANWPIHWLEALRGGQRGALQFRVVFSRQNSAKDEELIWTGWTGESDRVLVHYPDSAHVEFEYEHAGAPRIRSAPVPVDGQAVHVVRLEMGSLVPPPSWPGYDSWTYAQRTAVQRRLFLEVDGKPIFDRYQRFYPSSDGALVVGGVGTAAQFSGRIESLQREPLVAGVVVAPDNGSVPPPADGTWRLSVRFPAASAGTREPLIVSGETGRGDFLAIEYLERGQLRFFFDHWGSRSRFGPPITYVEGREYRIEISHSAYRTRGSTAADQSELIVTVDGRVAWRVAAGLYPADPEEFFVGYNPIGGSSCEGRFTGKIAIRESSQP